MSPRAQIVRGAVAAVLGVVAIAASLALNPRPFEDPDPWAVFLLVVGAGAILGGLGAFVIGLVRAASSGGRE